jgi:hypothetical protein
MGYVGEFGERPWWENPSSGPNAIRKAGEGLRVFLQIKDQREAERTREREEALSRFFNLAQKMPEVAERAGPEIVRKYGRDVPELAGMVEWLGNQKAIRQQMEGAGTSWLSGADVLQQQHQQSVQRKAMLALPPSPFGAPNLKAAGAALQEAAVHPDSFLQRSAEQMSPSQRMAAGIWAKEQGLPMPEPQYTTRPDPMRDLPQNQRALRISGTPEQMQAARVGADLESGARATSREGLARFLDQSRNRRAEAAAAISSRGLGLREQELALRRSEATAAKTGEAAGYKAIRPLVAETATAMRSMSAEQAKAWDAEVKEALGGKTSSIARDEARLAVTERLGPRPTTSTPMLPGHMNDIARMITREATTPPADPEERKLWQPATPEEVERGVEAAVDWYFKLTARGMAPREALDVVLGLKSEPAPPPPGLSPKALELIQNARGARP